MSGTLRATAVLTPEERYIQEQQRQEQLRAEARRRAEELARFEAARAQAGRQMMAREAQRQNAANRGLIMTTPTALKQSITQAQNLSQQQAAATQRAQAQVESHQRALNELHAMRQQFADQQQAAAADAAVTALEDAKALAVESQMWIAAGAPGDTNAQASSNTAQIERIQGEVATRPEEARRHADALVQTLRQQCDQLADGHFHRWSELLGDCSFELGRIQALRERLVESELDGRAAGSDPRVSRLLKELADAATTLEGAMNQSQQYSLDLAAVSGMVEHAHSEYDTRVEQTFDLIAERHQHSTITTIAEALTALGYHDSKQKGAAPQVRPIGRHLAVIALRQNPNSTTVDEKAVRFSVDEMGHVDADFSGYADRECEAAAAEVFAEFRRRGLALVREDAAIRLRKADPSTLSTNPEDYAGPEFAPYLDNSKRQPELRRRVLRALQRMGFQSSQVHEQVHDGTITLNASNGAVNYRVVLSPKSDERVDAIPPAVQQAMEPERPQNQQPVQPPVQQPARQPAWRRHELAQRQRVGG
jgi:hypothetical protein